MISLSIHRAAARRLFPNLMGGGSSPEATLAWIAEFFSPKMWLTLSMGIRRGGDDDGCSCCSRAADEVLEGAALNRLRDVLRVVVTANLHQ